MLAELVATSKGLEPAAAVFLLFLVLAVTAMVASFPPKEPTFEEELEKAIAKKRKQTHKRGLFFRRTNRKI